MMKFSNVIKDEWIPVMKKTKRLKLTIHQTLIHYEIAIMLLFIASLFGWWLIEMNVTSTYTGVRTAEELINVSLPFFLLAIFFAIIQYRRLKFKEFYVTFTDEQFQEAVERTVNEFEWRIDKNEETFFRAYTWDWVTNRGEMVTIIRERNRLLINSIRNPNGIASYGWSSKNIKTFLKNLSDVLNNKPAEIKVEKEIREWSVKNTLIRLFAYPFCIFLIISGFYMVVQPATGIYEGITRRITCFVGIAIASIYLYSDIKILITKNDKKRRQKTKNDSR